MFEFQMQIVQTEIKLLPYISAHFIWLFWCYYGVTYNFIQNHNQCWDLHQIFSCLFEMIGSMSEIIFSSDSMSKKYFFNSWKYMNVFFHFSTSMFWNGWKNNGSQMWEWQSFSSFTISDSN